MYSHIVMFKLEEEEDIPSTVSMLKGMDAHIPQIRFLEVGVNDSPSERAADIVLITRFDSREAMEAYKSHPHHRQVVAYLKQLNAHSTKVDYAD
jgi:quinol monooxygenase YgiN